MQTILYNEFIIKQIWWKKGLFWFNQKSASQFHGKHAESLIYNNLNFISLLQSRVRCRCIKGIYPWGCKIARYSNLSKYAPDDILNCLFQVADANPRYNKIFYPLCPLVYSAPDENISTLPPPTKPEKLTMMNETSWTRLCASGSLESH